MYILAFFSSNGTPVESINIPTIRIRELPLGTLIITDENMVEVGDGFYYYNFVNYDYAKDYAIRCDGTSGLPDSDRYVVCGNENYHEDINDVLDSNSAIKRILGLLHENISIDETVYDSDGNLVSSRIRLYDSSSNVGTDVGVIGEYRSLTTCTDTGKFTNWSQIKI
jgi:hypothetical protein